MATILSIDDDPELQDLVNRLLSGLGHKVQWAFSGEEGYEKARTQRPDVVILDLMLPTLNGIEVLKLFKADPTLRSVPVIVVTAFAEGHLKESEIRALGVFEFLRKPIQNDQLAALIEASLKSGILPPA